MYDFIYYQVRDVMTRDVVTVPSPTTMAEAGRTFSANDFNGLPVVDEGRLVGMLTKLDFLKAFNFTDKNIIPHYDKLMAEPVEHYMTRDLVCVDPETPLTRVVNRMILTRYKSFPVVFEGRLVGMVAREDVLGALEKAAKGFRPERLEGEAGPGA